MKRGLEVTKSRSSSKTAATITPVGMAVVVAAAIVVRR
jgi:hypothetical protein